MHYYYKCPKCRQNDAFHYPQEERMRRPYLGFAEWDFRLFEHRRVQCGHCRYTFYQPAKPRTGVAVLAWWVFWLVMGLTVIGAVLIECPELVPSLTAYPLLAEFEAWAVAEPRALMFGMILMIAVLLVLMPFIAVIANLRGRMKLRQEFLTEPTKFVAGPKAVPSDPTGAADTEDKGRDLKDRLYG